MPTDPSTALKGLFFQQPPKPIGTRIPLPEEDPSPSWAKSAFEGVADATLGMLGVGPETKANLGGQLVMAGLPLAGTTGIKGLFSRVGKVAEELPATMHPNKALSAFKNNASSEEMQYRGLADMLKAKGNQPVTKAEIGTHLDAHPLSVNVKTLGEPGVTRPSGRYAVQVSDPVTGDVRYSASDIHPTDIERLRQRYEPDHEVTFSEQSTTAPTIPTKFQRYQVPGGENYREHLITLPEAGEEGFQRLLSQRNAVDAQIQQFHDAAGHDRFVPHPPELVEQYNQLQRRIDGMQTQQWKSSHFDEPNILAHVRSNERTLPATKGPLGETNFVTGAKGRFLEEVQSDWHQTGKERGYRSPTPQPTAMEVDVAYGKFADRLKQAQQEAFAGSGDMTQLSSAHDLQPNLEHPEVRALHEQWDTLRRAREDYPGPGAPDAPFKDSWPDLALKQQLMDVAGRDDLSWIGHTTGDTQAARYDLSKQISEVHYSGTNLKAYDHAGNTVMDQTGITKDQLADHIGKEAAERLLAQPKQGTLQSLTGEDLKVGGEGMHSFYDNALPNKLRKILSPFGGKVELGSIPDATPAVQYQGGGRVGILGNEEALAEIYPRYANNLRNGVERGDTLSDLVNQSRPPASIPAWIAHLSPEMKKAILNKGLPLLSLGALMAQPESEPSPNPALRALDSTQR